MTEVLPPSVLHVWYCSWVSGWERSSSSPETSSLHHLHGGSIGNSSCQEIYSGENVWSQTKSTVSVLLLSQNHEIKIEKHHGEILLRVSVRVLCVAGYPGSPFSAYPHTFGRYPQWIRPLKISSIQSIDCQRVLCISGGTFYILLMLFSNAQGRYFSCFSFQIKSECRIIKHKN